MILTWKTYVPLILAFGLGLGAGWKLWRPSPLPASATQPKPASTLPDGGYVPAQHQDHSAKPQQDIPHGSTVGHQGTITVQPTAQSTSVEATPPMTGFAHAGEPLQPLTLPCPPVTIKWSLVTETDGAQRLVFKAEGGKVIGGDDIVVRPPGPPAKELKWLVLAKRYVREKTYGVQVVRTWGPAVASAEVKQSRADFGSGKLSADVAVGIGLRF